MTAHQNLEWLKLTQSLGELINFSSEYTQVASDLKDNPSHIYNYPHLFYLCGQNQEADVTVVNEHNEEEKAFNRFQELQELYNCTTPDQVNSICVKRYSSPTTRDIPLVTGKDDVTFEEVYSGTLGMPNHSITKIIHGGETLFENNELKNQQRWDQWRTLVKSIEAMITLKMSLPLHLTILSQKEAIKKMKSPSTTGSMVAVNASILTLQNVLSTTNKDKILDNHMITFLRLIISNFLITRIRQDF